jgi:PTS system mannose-specific IID component
MSERNYKLTDADLRKSWFTWIMFDCCSNNWERMQNIDWALAMAPTLRKLYPNDDKAFADRLTAHMEFFNTQPTVGCAILGIVNAMEEEKAAGKEIPSEAISSVKSSMMGPLAGIGDSVMNSLIEVILMSIAMTLAYQGNVFGPILYMITWVPISVGISWFLMKRGYELGVDSISVLNGAAMNRLVEGLTTVGLVVIGGLTATYVALSTTLQINVVDADSTAVQGVLDSILPGLLPLSITLFCYWLLTKKKVSPMVLILILFVVGTLLSVLGIC